MQAAFIIKNNREKRHHQLILILVIFHALFFIFFLFTEMWKAGFAGLVAIILNGSYGIWISRLSSRKFHFSERIFFFFGLLLSITNLWWLVFLETSLSMLFIFYYQMRSISFSPYLIEYRARPYKRYKWNDFSNVILKDNILTLDFKNNKLYQAEIENTDVDQDQFNAFAKDHLTKNI